jgi:hypothetical protein
VRLGDILIIVLRKELAVNFDLEFIARIGDFYSLAFGLGLAALFASQPARAERENCQ